MYRRKITRSLPDDDYYNAATQVDHVFLDSIREQAARLTAALLEIGPGR